MAQADGYIIIDSKIRTDGYKAGARDLEAAARKTAGTLSGIGEKARLSIEKSLNSVSKAQKKLSDLDAQAASLKKSISEAQATPVKTEAFSALEKDIQKAEESLAKLDAKKKRFIETGGDEESGTFSKMMYDGEQLDAQLDRLIAKKKEMESAGTAYTTADTSAFEEKLASIEEKRAFLVKELGFSYDSVNQKITEARNKADQLRREEAKAEKESHGIRRVFVAVAEKIKEAAAHTFRLKNASGGVGSNLSKSIGGAIRNILRYGFAIRSTYILVSKLKQFTGEGLKNMAGFSSGTNAAISSMLTSLNTLKNSLGAAFAPIVEAVAPMINSFISMMVNSINAVNQFISSLLGRSTFTKAIAVQQNYAGALNNTASGAGKAAKATKAAAKEAERFLTGYDEIQKATSDTGSGSSGGAGGGSGGGAGGGAAGNPIMFTTAQIEGQVSDFAQMFKESWEKADFTEIGGIIGGKLRDALDNIQWDGIKKNAAKVAQSLATLFNGFLETQGLSNSVGKTLGEALNTAFISVNTFVENFHWDSLGKFISSGIQSAFNTFNWGNVTKFVSGVVKGIFDFGTGLLEGIDFKSLPSDLANAIKEAITGYDFKGVFTSAGKYIGTAIVSAIDLLSGIAGLVGDFFKGVTDYFTKHINEAKKSGGSVADGILKGISDAFLRIGTWVKENILDPFIQGFKNAFGIHSPASNPKLLEAAGYVGKGILNGIADVFKNVGTWVKNNIITPIHNAIKAAGNIVLTVGASITTKASDLLNSFRSNWDSLKGRTLNLFAGIATKAGDLRTDFRNKWNSLKSKTLYLFAGIATKAGDLRTDFRNKWNSLKSKTLYLFAEISTKAASLWDGLKDSWNSIRDRTVSIFAEFYSGKFSSIGEKLWEGLKSSFNRNKSSLTVSAKGTYSFSGTGGRFETGGIIQHGIARQFASGGVLANGIARMWNSIPKYAGGTNNAHGSLFLAGESGPEVLGHVGGRTEILNKSQLAQVMHAAVVAGMKEVANAMLSVMSGIFTSAADAIMSGFSYMASMPNYLDQGQFGSLQASIDSITAAIPQINVPIPIIATGTIVPPRAAIETSEARVLKQSIDSLVGALTSQRGTDALTGGNNQPIVVQLVVDGYKLTDVILTDLNRRKNRGEYPMTNLI